MSWTYLLRFNQLQTACSVTILSLEATICATVHSNEAKKLKSLRTLASSPGSSRFSNVARRKKREPGKIHHVSDVGWKGLGQVARTRSTVDIESGPYVRSFFFFFLHPAIFSLALSAEDPRVPSEVLDTRTVLVLQWTHASVRACAWPSPYPTSLT